MSRQIVALALRTGIPVQSWLAGDWRDVVTAIDLLNDEDRKHRRDDGPVMSGGR